MESFCVEYIVNAATIFFVLRDRFFKDVAVSSRKVFRYKVSGHPQYFKNMLKFFITIIDGTKNQSFRN